MLYMTAGPGSSASAKASQPDGQAVWYQNTGEVKEHNPPFPLQPIKVLAL